MIYFSSFLIIFCFGAAIGFAIADVKRKFREEPPEHDPTNPNSCKCGQVHPLVSQFSGKCGSCWQLELTNEY
jgi:hypothetical protein